MISATQHTPAERDWVAARAIGRSKAEVTALAHEHGIARSTLYEWRKDLTARGRGAIEAARHPPPARPVSTLPLLLALEHALDCGDPDCARCLGLQERLEDPDDLEPLLEAVAELRRFSAIEDGARNLIIAVRTRDGSHVEHATARLERVLGAKMASKYTLQEQHHWGLWSIGKSRREVEAKAEVLGVSPATVYGWRKQLQAAGPDAVRAAELGLAPPPPTENIEDLQAENEVLATRVRTLEQAVADYAIENLRLRRHAYARTPPGPEGL